MMLGYVRVSTQEQASSDRSSLQEQVRVIKGIAMTRGVQGFDLTIYSDPGVSGTIPLHDRPAGKELLAIAKRGDIVCASKLDRMFRSASDALVTAEKMKVEGIDLILFDLGHDPVTSNGMAKFFFTMVGAFAELERTKIADRMQEGKRGKRARGGHTGGYAPFGFRKVGAGRDARLEPDTEEQDILRLTQDLHQHRNYRKLHKLADALNDMGVRSRAGGQLQRVQVARMLRNVEAMSG
jgi:putative DNA-invertase from lambdoid prophage Rac